MQDNKQKMFVDFSDMEISAFIWYTKMKKSVTTKYLNLLKNYLKCIFELWKELSLCKIYINANDRWIEYI